MRNLTTLRILLDDDSAKDLLEQPQDKVLQNKVTDGRMELQGKSIDVDLAARRLQQLLLLPKIGLSPLPQPTIPTVLKSGSLPRLPSIPNLSSALKVTLPSFPLIPTISTTIPSIHFLFPPPLTTSS
ncbi:hypothetical protein V6N12_074604 [Hibiscus sabdariffa]|uniref:Uncharacterized protein n=1 Tax=Hibiscus sabdariffa TaxID=183260 RepID=A0ABR2BYA7_9ROSI